ncbi:hypothetical protein TEA_029323 [Camellia sinensis var. sinensis]|uniref:Uncharacterized protein n=1 Tax=Camellia sinensis var. sinensis TaxID=542762 RepID=A0A4S4DEA1_CAMSN|nr:hypothetical protein TEA_029323 [Camellia sinensis var. sinensis]
MVDADHVPQVSLLCRDQPPRDWLSLHLFPVSLSHAGMGAEANAAEQTPVETTPENVEALLEAARYDDIDDVTNLASAGISLDSKDSQGRTALHMASANGHLDIVDYLIRNGVKMSEMGLDIQLMSDMFMLALNLCIMSKSNVTYVLYESREFSRIESPPHPQRKQDVNASNVEKNTPLHWACLNGHIEVVKNLILAGASVSVLNSHERTPMDEAVSRGKMDVIDAINTAVTQVELSSASVS